MPVSTYARQLGGNPPYPSALSPHRWSFAGTGKTLMARALANECSLGDRKVAFFMRKGADVLSKWVGESERQLRLLFDQVGPPRGPSRRVVRVTWLAV